MENILERRASIPTTDVGNCRVTKSTSKQKFRGAGVELELDVVDIPTPMEEKPFSQTWLGKKLTAVGECILTPFKTLAYYQYSKHIGELYKPHKI